MQSGEAAFIKYAHVQQTAGLSYGPTAAAEFLARGPGAAAQLQTLEQQYGIIPLVNISSAAIDNAAVRLQNAFSKDAWGRILRAEDAKVLAAAFLTQDRLATGDLQLFKRARDLGLSTDFVGAGSAATRAMAYVPRSVTIPPP